MDDRRNIESGAAWERKTTAAWLDWGSEYVGTGILRLQGILILVALAVWIFFRILGVSSSLPISILFTLCIGNWSALIIFRLQPIYVRRQAPWNWIIFIFVVVLGGVSGSIFAEAVIFVIFAGNFSQFPRRVLANAPVATLVTLIYGIVTFVFEEKKSEMERRQLDLQGQVQLGRVREQSHEAELEQAHEIQRHLLPRETPQIAGFQIACAWQPAKSVSGDYFDVLPLGEGRLGLCIADVSGKGITAALLMANLQASVKAFAPEAASSAVLCAKLNSVLCDTVAPGKFVTLFYGVIDTQQRRLHYENAGHCLPLLVHADGSILMPASFSGVLGLFSHWTYQNSEVQLKSGDCLVLMTDGVLEAANRDEEEFGYQRLIDVVQAKRGSGVHGIRTAILEAVSAFCEGKFDDDASLIVVTVD
jgi:sigma-B regulation protein RsbU (phosphoserine phosphatase)